MACALARQGCTRIALTDIAGATLASTARRLRAINPGVALLAEPGDVSDEGFVDGLVAAACGRFGRVDYAVNCAGVLGGAALRSHETPAAAFDRINAVNYRGSWLVSRAVLGRMVGQDLLPEYERLGQRGSVVNIASQLGIAARPEAGMSPSSRLPTPLPPLRDIKLPSLLTGERPPHIAAYCASKAAVIGMTKADAVDYSRDGIRVNCVCPGIIATPMTTATEDMRARLRPSVDIAPMRRMGAPEEVAGAVLFLCSSDASFVQGHALVVDGGYTIN